MKATTQFEVTKSKFIRHVPCDSCGSRDAGALYEDGSGYCFSCNKYIKPSERDQEDTDVIFRKASKPQSKNWMVYGETKELAIRCLTKETCARFEYQVGEDFNEKPVQIANYYKGSVLSAQKLRYQDKTFKVIGDTRDLPLFGAHLWAPGGKMIVITEGEIDCLSVSQALGHKWACVSVPSGAQSAKKSCAQALEYLTSFDKVVLCFDMDEPGRKAAQEVAALLPPGKAYIASLPAKDANLCLQTERKTEMVQAIWQAQPWRPDGIMSESDMRKALDFRARKGLSYPWQGLTEMSYGVRPGEMVTLLAGSGVGKSDFMKEIVLHMLTAESKTVGAIFLEETPSHTLLSIIGKRLNKILYLPESSYTQAETISVFDEIISGGRFLLYDHKGTSDWECIKSRIRYMAHQGAEIVILDHLTAIAYGKETDPNAYIHLVMEELNALCMELEIIVFMISHIRKQSGGKVVAEEGGKITMDDAYGSAAIKQRSSFVFSLERNQQAENEEDRCITTLRCLKDRYTGRGVGKSMKLHYNQQTGRLRDFGNAF